MEYINIHIYFTHTLLSKSIFWYYSKIFEASVVCHVYREKHEFCATMQSGNIEIEIVFVMCMWPNQAERVGYWNSSLLMVMGHLLHIDTGRMYFWANLDNWIPGMHCGMDHKVP